MRSTGQHNPQTQALGPQATNNNGKHKSSLPISAKDTSKQGKKTTLAKPTNSSTGRAGTKNTAVFCV